MVGRAAQRTGRNDRRDARGGDPPPHLTGALGQLARTDRAFPRPFNAQFGRVWWHAGIEAWAGLHRPDLAAPDNPFRGEATVLLQAAEREAVARLHGYLGCWHLWLALLADEAPAGPREVLRSMGVAAADIVEALEGAAAPTESEPRTRRMNPRVQQVLTRARPTVGPVTGVGILEALLDEFGDDAGRRGRGGPVELWLAARGFDPVEARRRLRGGEAEPRTLGPRPAPQSRPDLLRELHPNPLGRDPWDRKPWGSVGVRLRDNTGWRLDGDPVCIFFDRDGYTVRTPDGRPVGYVLRRDQPIGTPGPIEVLPMPPPTARDWTRRPLDDGD